MSEPFRLSARRRHLDADNMLRSLTAVIDAKPDGINLGQGVCDLDMPKPLVAGAIDAIDGGERQTYTHYSGLDGLKRQIVAKLAHHNDLVVSPDQVMATVGSSGAFSVAALTLLEPGDEVILFEPFYPYHPSTLRLADAEPVAVPLVDGTYDGDRFRAALTPRTRAVMINTPANPSGAMFDLEALSDIADAIDGSDVVVFTDEVYEYMTYDGRRHISPATVPGLAERTITMSSFSKTYSITGWRLGYLVGPADVVAACGRVADQIVICPSRPVQRAVERALAELPDSFYTSLRDDYQRKRDAMCGGLAAAGFDFITPQGAYYVLADYRQVLGDIGSSEAVLAMIERIGVNAVPGALFHADGESARDIRFHFAVDDHVLADVVDRLGQLAQ